PGGVTYLIRDPMPCLDNYVAGSNWYVSNAVGNLCQNPAFIPNRLTASGFTPTAADAIVLHYADGTTASIPFAAGRWAIPSRAPGGGVAEVEIPAFAGEATNTANITFQLSGWAAENAVPGRMIRNVANFESYVLGAEDPFQTQDTGGNVWIADPNNGA